MSKKSKKSNLKDTSAEFSISKSTVQSLLGADNDAVEFAPKDTVDPAQIDLEEQIEEETGNKKPQFKDSDKSIRLPGHTESITNDNLTEVVKCFLIDSEVCTESDFI